MTPNEVLSELRALGDEKRRAHNARHGAGENQFGVPMGDLRALAKKIRTDHALAVALWKTGNIDAQLLGISTGFWDNFHNDRVNHAEDHGAFRKHGTDQNVQSRVGLRCQQA